MLPIRHWFPVALASVLFSTGVHAQCAQCPLASVAPYNFNPPNPVQLTTSFPFPFPVVGNMVKLDAIGAEPGSFGFLGLSESPASVPLGPSIDGGMLISLNTFALAPYTGIPAWTFSIPCGFPAGFNFYAQSAHSKSSGGFELSSALHLVTGGFGAEIGVTSLTLPSNPIGGIGPLPYGVTLHNYGNAPAVTDVTVCVGPNCWTVPLGPVPAGGNFSGTVWVNTPPSFGVCGGSNPFPVTACSNLGDCNPGNNCLSKTMSIAVPYWDLDFAIINNPLTAHPCGSASWTVRVKNLGNINSDNVCAFTGINCSPGAGNYGCLILPGGLFDFTTPNIAPGKSWDFHVSNYLIGCAAFLGTQYIKAEINYVPGGCFDNCHSGDNFDQKAISIIP